LEWGHPKGSEKKTRKEEVTERGKTASQLPRPRKRMKNELSTVITQSLKRGLENGEGDAKGNKNGRQSVCVLISGDRITGKSEIETTQINSKREGLVVAKTR